MYRDYFLRSVPTLWPTLLQLGAKLGAVNLTYTEFEESLDENGFTIRTPVGAPIVSAVEGAWDYIGEILQPTGEMDGDTTVMEPIKDSEGVPYLHANLRTTINLREVAESMDDPEISEALNNLDKFFVTDAEGEPVIPALPHRVWA